MATATRIEAPEAAFYTDRIVNALAFGKPHNPLQARIMNNLLAYMREQGANIQRKPTQDTNLVLVPAEMGEDVGVQDLALLRLGIFRFGPRMDRLQAKVTAIVTTQHIPTSLGEMEPDHIGKVLNTTSRDPVVLNELAREQELSHIIAFGYPELPRKGSNLALIAEGLATDAEPSSAYLIGLEQSYPRIAGNGRFYADLYDRLVLQATAQMVINNRLMKDLVLPQEVWLRSKAPEGIIEAGKRMQELGLYPPPFPFKNFIGRLKAKAFGAFLQLTGLSYGNTAMRASKEEASYGVKFWMSRSGARKDDLKKTEVYAAGGWIRGTNDMGRVAIQGLEQPGRMSVDAVEIEQILDAFPEIGATVHGHVWIKDPETGQPMELFDGVREILGTLFVCAKKQRPCGSVELGEEAVAALRQSHDVKRTAVLQPNHGINSMGEGYDEMFTRLQALRDSGLITNRVPQN